MAAGVDSELRTVASSAGFEPCPLGDGDSGKAGRASAGSGRIEAVTLLAEVAAVSALRGLSVVTVQQRSASVVISKVHLRDRTGARRATGKPSQFTVLRDRVSLVLWSCAL
jgi:hypothetical protein